jgi:hypothetical protein
MLINDLEHLEMIEQYQQVEGGARLLRVKPRGVAQADFGFNSLVVGSVGSYAGGDTQILTTATPEGFNTGFSFVYQSVATGGPIPA